MQRYKVPDMGCAHCVQTIENSIHALDPAANILCNLTSKEVTVETSLAPSRVGAALEAAGYKAETITAEA